MSVISVIIEESAEQLIAGFPKSISITTNISSTIFYTTNGEDPTLSSDIYLEPFDLPLGTLSLILKVYATNGTDASPIITKVYSTNIINNTRLPHSPGNDISSANDISLFPFGSNSPPLNVKYLNNAQAGTTVQNPSSPVIPFGYDGSGNVIGANQPINEYLNVYSTTDWQNKSFPNVGNLPAKTTIIGKNGPTEYSPQSSSRADKLFNPRALVIFQDSTTDDPSNPPQINPQYFNMGNQEIINRGTTLSYSGQENASITGSYLKTHYNPRTQMLTAYYRDTATNRWIISTFPYEPKDADQGNLSGFISGRGSGVGKVFQWHLFQYRTLI